MKIIKFKRKVSVNAAVYSSGASTWTLTTAVAHLLAVGDVFQIYNFTGQKLITVTTIAGTTGSTIVFSNTSIDTDATATLDNYFYIYSFPTGFTGLSEVENIGTTLATMQATTTIVSGTGSHSIQYQYSNDKIGWINGNASAPSAAATSVTDGFTLANPWLYGRFNVVSVTGTGAKLTFTVVGERL